MLIATIACLTPLQARAASPAEIQFELKRFATVARVLMVAAHPDDENTQLITYLARGRGYRMAYLSVTRGDGGQNVLGPEFGDELGWIRTNELLAARRLDGGEQFFTRARDFGFSKSPVETLNIWDKPAVLGDVVRVIRTLQPDVIVTRFSPNQTNTHGHHTASAILAVEAFKLAADPNAYPEQLKQGLGVWQAKRILQNTGGFLGGGGGLPMHIAGDDPVLHLSYAEIAGRSRAMHKSQGFGNFNGGRGGARAETFNLLAGDPATTDIMDGVDTTWARVQGAEAVAGKVADVMAKFDPQQPAASVPGLVAIKAVLRTLPAGGVIDERVALLDRIIADCLGLTVEATVTNALVTPGSEVTLTHSVHLGTATTPVRLTGIAEAGATAIKAIPGKFEADRPLVVDSTVSIASDRGVTQPYWLSEPAATGLYTVSDPTLIGRPENPPAIPVAFTFDVGGQPITLRTEPVQADSRRRVEVIAPVSLAFPFDVRLFKPGVPRDVQVEATAHAAGLKGTVQLDAPAGWKVEPAGQPLEIATAGERRTATFKVTPPTGPASADLHASATVGGVTYATGWKEIRYPHLPPLLLQPPVKLRAVSLDLAIAAKSVGYLPGAGDSVADCLAEMGCDVTRLTTDDLDPAKLKQFDAVVVGVRAFNVRDDLGKGAKALFDYAEAGGTLVEQYNRPDGLKSQQLGPYPLKLSGSRITDESATLTFLAPDHPALHVPNKITPADFDGWVQERGIYFPSQWDDRWTPILAGNDPGEPPLKGGLLIAAHGKGHVVYTGLVFFRELPAGVPGAYRLFANLVSLGRP